MTNRVSYAPQDFQKKCKQAERDHETRKLAVLLDKVKKQIEDRDNPRVEAPKRALMSVTGLPGHSAIFER
jgi:hypothetical protein